MIGIIKGAFSRPRTVLLLLVLILISGTVAYVTIPKESDPDIDIPIIYVSMHHDGISPEDAERLIRAHEEAGSFSRATAESEVRTCGTKPPRLPRRA